MWVAFCRYPYNLDFNYGELESLQKFSINNLGDPFIESNYGVHSREFEVSLRMQAMQHMKCSDRGLAEPA